MKARLENIQSQFISLQKSMQTIRQVTQAALLTVVAFTNTCLVQAMEMRKCTIMHHGWMEKIETCSFRESKSAYIVRTASATYRLDTNSYPPILSIDGKRTSSGSGAYSSSSVRECEFFIALRDQRESYNLSYSNFPMGLCVLQ